jgi:hypothetical protein
MPNPLCDTTSRGIVRISFLSFALGLFVWTSLGSLSQAEARSPKLKLDFSSTQDEISISFSAKGQAIPNEKISVKRDKAKRLRFTIDGGYRCRARYIKKWRAAKLKRVYLYPSSKVKGRCYLLVRMTHAISPELVSAIQMNQEAESTVAIFSWSLPPEPSVGPEEAVQGDTSAQKTDSQTKSTTQEPSDSASTDVVKSERAESEKATPEAKPDSPPAPLGDLPAMEAPKDEIVAQDMPHDIIMTAVIGQLNKARALTPAPVILSTPMTIDAGAELSPQEHIKLKLSSKLLTAMIDQEALQRGGGIWIADQDFRDQVGKLNPHTSRLSISQEQILARHTGAGLISRTQLSLTEGGLSLTTSMTPISNGETYQEADPGVYQVEHTLSSKILDAAIDQAWVKEYRSSAIWRSALLPGWGHLYRGEHRQGLTYLTAGLGLVAGALISSTLGYMAAQDYADDNPSTSHRRDDANAHYDRANLLWIGAAVVHLTSFVDTVASARDRAYLDVSRLNWNDARRAAEREDTP